MADLDGGDRDLDVAPKPEPNLTLSYFSSFRGRIEPMHYLLIDSDTPYNFRGIEMAEWPALKSQPALVPFAKLPTLEVGIGHDGRKSIISETSAILRFIHAMHRSPEAEYAYTVPVATAQHDMVLEASLAISHDWSRTWYDETSFTPSKLSENFAKMLRPYLVSLEAHLTAKLFPPLLLDPPQDGRPGSSLYPAAAAASYLVELIANLYGSERLAKQFPSSIALRDRVHQRPRIAAWLKQSGQQQRPRGYGLNNSYENIEALAERIANGDIPVQGLDE